MPDEEILEDDKRYGHKGRQSFALLIMQFCLKPSIKMKTEYRVEEFICL